MATDPRVLTIYIVDDDESVRRGLSRLMRSAGFEPRAFGTAESFLGAVSDEVPGCILLDITMPQVTGLEIQERLNRAGVRLPVIAVSARDDDPTRRLAHSLGAEFFLRKPVDDQALLDAIGWVTDRREAGGPGRRPEST